MAYFEKLNYSLSNEDTRIEFELLKQNVDSVFAIAGSGARVLPLVARNPKSLTIVDLSPEQLYMTELRIAAARALTYEEFLFFLGYRGGLFEGHPEGDDRSELFQSLELSDACRSFWKTHQGLWEPRGFILLGKWENHFQKLGEIFRKVLRIDMELIFEAQSLPEQMELYEKHFRPVLFRTFLRGAASEFVFNRFLYKGHFSGTADRRTEALAPWKFIDENFRRLFTTTLVRKNYFLQMLFLGRIRYEEGLPLEAQSYVVEAVRTSQTELDFQCGNLIAALPKKAFDFISLSDAISYVVDEQSEWILQKLHPDTKVESTAVIRTFLRAPKKIMSAGWIRDDEKCRWANSLDGTGVYQFHIYSKLAAE